MIIRELNVLAFGRLQRWNQKLEPGLNLIIGPNEAGKTTLQQFILRMLYGFARPELKVRRLAKAHEQYRPWVGEQYGGSLALETYGREYRLERDFLNHSFKVFDYDTGEEITSQLPVDRSTREVQFCQHILDLSVHTFRNTLWWGTLPQHFSAQFQQHFQENTAHDVTGDHSLGLAQKLMDEEIHALGSERAVTKPIGATLLKIAELEQRKNEALQQQQLIRAHQQQLRQLQKKVVLLEKEKTQQSQQLEALETALYRHKLHRVRLGQERLQQMYRRVARLAPFANINEAHLLQAQEQEDQRQRCLERIRAFSEDIKTLETDLVDYSKALGTVRVEDHEIEALERAWWQWQEHTLAKQRLVARINVKSDELEQRKVAKEALPQFGTPSPYDRLVELEVASEGLSIEALHGEERRLQNMLSAKQSVSGRYVVPMVMGLMVAVGMFFISPWAGLMLIIPILLYVQESRRQQVQRQESLLLQQRLQTIEVEKKRQQQLQWEIEEERQSILEKYGVQSRAELRAFEEEKRLCALEVASIEKDILRLKEDLAHCQETKNSVTQELQKIALKWNRNIVVSQVQEQTEACLSWARNQQRLQKLITTALSEKNKHKSRIAKLQEQCLTLTQERDRVIAIQGFPTLAMLEDAVLKKEERMSLKKAIAKEEQILQDVLEGYTISDLEERVAQSTQVLGISEGQQPSLQSMGQRQRQVSEINQKLTEVKEEVARVEATLQTLEEQNNLMAISEVLAWEKRKLDRLQTHQSALTTAFSVLQEVAQELHREYAPECNAKVAYYLNLLTGSRYAQARVSQELAVTVTSPETGQWLSLTDLSAGTIDQVYFATRLALADLVTGRDNLPFILDDPFALYDDQRLEMVLSLVESLAKSRQILLFTCRQREKSALNAIKATYNLVTI